MIVLADGQWHNVYYRLRSGIGVCMELFAEEYWVGNLKMDVSVQEGQGCRVIITARDDKNRRIWRTPLTDENGEIKIYSSHEEAILEARKALGVVH